METRTEHQASAFRESDRWQVWNDILATLQRIEQTQRMTSRMAYTQLEAAEMFEKWFDNRVMKVPGGWTLLGMKQNMHEAWNACAEHMIRILAGDKYEQIVRDAKAGADGPNTYEWEEGVAP